MSAENKNDVNILTCLSSQGGVLRDRIQYKSFVWREREKERKYSMGLTVVYEMISMIVYVDVF